MADTDGIQFDRTGFPLIAVAELGLWVHLFPVTKLQFEEWLAEPDTPGDHFYDEAQGLSEQVGSGAPSRGNPRIVWRDITGAPSSYVRILMTGLQPRVCLQFAGWLGKAYDLPSVDEWRIIQQSWGSRDALCPPSNCPEVAARLWQKLYEAKQPKTLLGQSFMDQGIIEWTWEDEARSSVACLGRPHTDVLGNTWKVGERLPLPVDPDGRFWLSGCRLVRRS